MSNIKLSEKYKKEFAPQIIERGIQYYNNLEVEKLFKSDNLYIAKFYGHSSDYDYTVQIEVLDDSITMNCTCPYQDNCKHEYATLIAIDNEKYKVIDLKPEIKKNELDLVKLINSIPEDELKKYISMKTDNEFKTLTIEDLKDYFIKYQPKENRDYYYNNLYNKLVMDDIPISFIEDMIVLIRKYIVTKEYEQAYIIFTSIIDAMLDTRNDLQMDICFERIIDIYNKLTSFARIIYRRAASDLKNKFDIWLNKYAINNYYDDVFLEDLLLSIKNN